jgi:PAS domain S-box-containing protein
MEPERGKADLSMPDFPNTLDSGPDDRDQWKALCRTIMGTSRCVLLAVDQQGCIIFSNPAAGQRIGAHSGDSLAQALPALWGAAAGIFSDGNPRVDMPVAIAGDEYLASIYPVSHYSRTIAAVIEMVQGREKANEASQIRLLREMARERDAIIDSSSDGLFVCDGNATVIRINPASERIHKIKAAAVIGKNMLDLIKEGFIDRSAAVEAIRKRSAVNLLQKKGKRKLISTGTPVFSDSGELIRVVVSEKDITAFDALQRRLEAEQQIKNQLRNQLVEMQQDVLLTHKIIARSPNMVKALQRALKVSKADSSILITGESGVGKGLIANLIHKNSPRADKPLIRINCGAIPESLVESELFGYEKGAFTGARAGGKPGHLEVADGGTLFLDEIAELSLSAQVKLLRFLENGRITRLGGTQTRLVDARIIAATHRDLKQMVTERIFRNDLYYRLNVIPLFIPPLRDRKDCLLPLLRHYVDYFARKAGSVKRLSQAAVESLMTYSFPGNVRELMNICERLVVMSEMEVIGRQDLPKDVINFSDDVENSLFQWPAQMSLEQVLQSVERALLMDAVKVHPNQSKIATALGVSQPTVARRMKKYGLPPTFAVSSDGRSYSVLNKKQG